MRYIEAPALIVIHRFWRELDPADALAACDALKHHREQKPADAASRPTVCRR
ncbi:hypothetical protein [Streptomyces pseudoechinosporeus]